jgi:adenylate kinase family enzyme
MQRIAVIGSGGSGKSFVSRALGRRLGITVTHLDAVYFDKDWNSLPRDEFAELQRLLVAEPAWIIDGNYRSTMEIRLREADTIVMLDVSTAAALWGGASRQRCAQPADLGGP